MQGPAELTELNESEGRMQFDRLGRRKFIMLLAGASAAPALAARAQQAAKVARIGFLGATFAPGWATRIEALRSGLRDLGYVEGKNILIEPRWAEEQYGRLPALAAELVRLDVDVLLTYGTPGTLAAKRATTDIPIVFLYSGEAVAAGLVASLPRPGGNVTGTTYFLPQLLVKRLELLKEVLPQMTRVAILVKPDNPLFKSTLPILETAANSLKIELQRFDAHGPSDFEAAFSAMGKTRVEAIVFQEDAVFLDNLRAIGDLATRQSLPFAGSSEFAEAGALIGYGVDFLDMCRRAAMFVDKILKGAKPAEVPVEQATKFETVLNMKAAKSLGITIPTSMLLRADRVVE
jgi:putative ABC transport system substrate-binding protein